MSLFVLRRRDYWILIFFCILMGFFGLWLGQPLDYDLHGYHYYNAHALWTWRWDRDIHPSHLQAYLNPLIDLPHYLWHHVLQAPPVVFGFLWSSLFGIPLTIMYRVLDDWMVRQKFEMHPLILVAAAFVFGASPVFLNGVGNTYNDVITALGWTIAVWLILRDEKRGERPFELACFFAGVSTALKLTYLNFLIPFILLAFWYLWGADGWRGYVRRTMRSALALTVGFLVGGGWWNGFLFFRFGNPIFPLMNQVFRNPWMNPTSLNNYDTNDMVFSWKRIFGLPLSMLDNQISLIHSFGPFRDARPLILCLTLVVVAVCVIVQRLRSVKSVRLTEWTRAERFIALFFLASTAMWSLTAFVYRYYVIGDFLIPILTLALWSMILPARRAFLLCFALFAGAFIYQRAPYEMRISWQDSTIGIAPLEPLAKIKDSLILLPGNDNIAYVAAFMDGSNTFIRLQGSLDRFQLISEKFKDEIRRRISSYRGPVYALFIPANDGSLGFNLTTYVNGVVVPLNYVFHELDAALSAYGFRKTDDCLEVHSYYHTMHGISLCRLVLTESSQQEH